MRYLGTLLLLLPLLGATDRNQGPAPEGVVLRAGTVLEIRLRQTLSSFGSKRGTPVLAEVIAPVESGGRVIVPPRTELLGRVRDVRKVGLGFSRDTALLDLEFDRIRLPGQEARSLSGKMSRVDDARERVDERGRIRGIRATDSFGTMLAGAAISLCSFDPMALAFGLSASVSVFRPPSASIVLPVGTELHFRVESDVSLGEGREWAGPALAGVEERFGALIRTMPFRTETQTGREPSDLTSLMYVGSREAIARAFEAAGWVKTDALDGQSSYGVMKSIVENQGYRAAPMSVLLLDGKEPEFTYAKTLNTFFSRHHLRIYARPETHEGRAVWTSTATYDSGIGFSRAAKTFIHLINEHIDEERTKVVNDLVLTGCVDGVGYVGREWVPRDAKNATGDSLRTDGRIAVLTLNECASPARATVAAPQLPLVKTRQAAWMRPLSATMLTLRHDMTRGNMAFQAYSAVRMAVESLKKPEAGGAEPRALHIGGQEFQIVTGSAPAKKAGLPADPGAKLEREEAKRRPKSYATGLMFSLSGGLSGYGNARFSTLPLELVLTAGSGAEVRDPIALESKLERGWTLAPKVTLNTWKHYSSEFGYSRTSTTYRVFGREALTGAEIDQRAKAAIRTYTYNGLLHLRPNGKRVRPYVAGGPALQLTHLLEAKAQTSGLLKFASRDVALFLTAYDFGTKSPMEGGGAFQVGLNYGGGVHVHVTPRLFFRVDYRETLTGQPDFWKSSAAKLGEESPEGLRVVVRPQQMHGPMRHQLVTAGIGIAF